MELNMGVWDKSVAAILYEKENNKKIIFIKQI